MRRSAALLSLLLLLPLASASHAAPVRAPAPVFPVGIFDPNVAIAVSTWALLEAARIMDLADDLLEHVREDVRRSQHPQRNVPRIVPAPLPMPMPITPVLPTVPLRPVKPLVDFLPLGRTS